MEDGPGDGLPVIAVITVSDAFSSLWAELAESAGGRVRVGATEAELAPVDGVAGAIVAAGGAEVDAAEAVQGLTELTRAPVIVVGAAEDHRIAAALVRAGASDYFALPSDIDALRGWMEERINRARAVSQAGELAEFERAQYDFSRMIGESPELKAALRRASKVIARSTATVLITGETGTGKELLAQAIHYNGPRAAKPIVEVNCSALPANLLEAELFGYEKGAFTGASSAKPGLFEAAQGGTVFLDEIGEIALELQAKLLRAIEAREVRRLGSVRTLPIDIRLIAATHVDLARAVRNGSFREDLYYRLNVIPIHLPPLRERGNDVLLLATAFMESLGQQYGITTKPLAADVRAALLSHRWSGNVRELRNAIERALLLGDGALHRADLFLDAAASSEAPSPIPFPATMDEIETAAAREMVARFDGNKTAAATALGISRSRLYRLVGEDEQ
jgi:DNA-binding NtrC family response regulator